MMMSELRLLLHPSTKPVILPTENQIADAEKELGLRLPDDYKQFIAQYGGGSLARFIRLCSPGSNIETANLVDMARSDWDGYAFHKKNFPDIFSYPRYPDAGGLLPWADTINGDVIYWLTEGDCNSWPVVIFERGGTEHYNYGCGMATFFGRLIKGEIQGDPFPDNVPFGRGEYVVASL